MCIYIYIYREGERDIDIVRPVIIELERQRRSPIGGPLLRI